METVVTPSQPAHPEVVGGWEKAGVWVDTWTEAVEGLAGFSRVTWHSPANQSPRPRECSLDLVWIISSFSMAQVVCIWLVMCIKQRPQPFGFVPIISMIRKVFKPQHLVDNTEIFDVCIVRKDAPC